MNRSEWFYVTEGGSIINACTTSNPAGPTIVLTTPGRWVHESKVSDYALGQYEFNTERP